MNIEQIKQQYKDQWVLLEVLEEDVALQLTEGNVLKHSEIRDEVYDALLKTPKGSRVAVVFTGKPLQEGYAAAFLIFRIDEN